MNLAGRDENGFTPDVERAIDPHAGERCCRGCRRWLPETDYYFRRKVTGYMLRVCRRCHADRDRLRYRNTSLGERKRARARARYWANPEPWRAKARQQHYDRKLAGVA